MYAIAKKIRRSCRKTYIADEKKMEKKT